MPRNPAPFVVLQETVDELEEALARQDAHRIRHVRARLQTQLAEHDLRHRAASSLARNGMSRYTRGLLRGMGFEVRPLT